MMIRSLNGKEKKEKKKKDNGTLSAMDLSALDPFIPMDRKGL